MTGSSTANIQKKNNISNRMTGSSTANIQKTNNNLLAVVLPVILLEIIVFFFCMLAVELPVILLEIIVCLFQ
jgi:hypothetical protein